ncbi:peptidoglycan glycosyltransferase [Desulfobulbus propionicus DSM 2032]|uniref:Peptidoglycan glycosyltransferase n=1 Tax=Desulfobulbus propionicus (strain ATCC 33891 / DSM 2032 / VKM B-1956 / 1pr3) TaxID=577650 RepID=A0A7U4DND6_DESPD|nr:penicillin-binding protein 2 [Desulfobulbus propionicus]ADW16927.1 peptidoglycan glycosyltransferase [Desulfobulbus propionicus DSM 2032]
MSVADLLGSNGNNIRKSNRKRAEPLLDAERRKDNGVTKLTQRDESDLNGYRKKALYAVVILIFFFAVIVTRLWFLQVQQGDYYSTLADSNRVRSVEIAAPRGNIYDSKGREIVTNRPSFNVVWMRENNKIDDEWLKNLTRILREDPSVLLEKIRKMSGTPGHLPVRLAEDIDWETVARIENNRMYLPEIKIEVVPLRIYHFGNLASHLIGYMGEISKAELDKADKTRYKGGDLIGKMGLERLREVDLRGEKGHDNKEVNALGFEQQNLKGDEPLPGNDLHLTLDVELQKIAEEEMAAKNRAGAVVAMEANTGRLLVLASAPELHLEEFVGGISQKAWQEMLDNPLHPLINKVVQGQYPPGSTYKPVTAFAGLAEGIVTPDTTVFCPGFYRFGNRVYRCWKKGGHGTVSLRRALGESCDVYFYQVGLKLGVDRLGRYAKLFGLGEKTGVEMEHEKAGIVPTSEWKKKRYGVKWHEGETLSIAIGQGYDLTTPLQIALMTSVIANGGTLYKPTIVEQVRDPDGKLVSSFQPEVLSRLSGQGRNLKLVREGMIEAVNGRRGTGREAQIDAHGIIVGGKTGTAQVVRLAQYKHLKEENIPYEYRDHAWFTCFAPAANPEIVVTVLVEHGLHGGSASAPIAAKILNRYFEDKLKGSAENTADTASGNRVILSQDMIEETDPPPDEAEEEGGQPNQPTN